MFSLDKVLNTNLSSIDPKKNKGELSKILTKLKRRNDNRHINPTTLLRDIAYGAVLDFVGTEYLGPSALYFFTQRVRDLLLRFKSRGRTNDRRGTGDFGTSRLCYGGKNKSILVKEEVQSLCRLPKGAYVTDNLLTQQTHIHTLPPSPSQPHPPSLYSRNLHLSPTLGYYFWAPGPVRKVNQYVTNGDPD